jgi:hypothetical protein
MCALPTSLGLRRHPLHGLAGLHPQHGVRGGRHGTYVARLQSPQGALPAAHVLLDDHADTAQGVVHVRGGDRGFWASRGHGDGVRVAVASAGKGWAGGKASKGQKGQQTQTERLRESVREKRTRERTRERTRGRARAQRRKEDLGRQGDTQRKDGWWGAQRGRSRVRVAVPVGTGASTRSVGARYFTLAAAMAGVACSYDG